MDFDFLLAGKEIEYKGRKYVVVKYIAPKHYLVAEIGVQFPAPIYLIPASNDKKVD